MYVHIWKQDKNNSLPPPPSSSIFCAQVDHKRTNKKGADQTGAPAFAYTPPPPPKKHPEGLVKYQIGLISREKAFPTLTVSYDPIIAASRQFFEEQ